MIEKYGNKQIEMVIESPLIIGGMEIGLSESRLVLKGDKNLMIHCERPELGEALVRAILGLEKLSKGTINIDMGGKGSFIDRRRFVDFSREEIRMAYVSVDGSDYCRDLTIRENLGLIENIPDFNQRIQDLATEFLVEENLDDFPDAISIRRRKIYSIIRAWAYLPDIIVYSNPLEYLDDFSKIEILRNLAIPIKDSAWLTIILVP
ncbi:MAG: P-loop NTPase family protein [Planctomycetota bacterium]|jgi:ABC-type molybdate transport system ATPase subunit